MNAKKIVIVDDDEVFSYMACKSLQNAGFATIQFSNGTAALEWLCANSAGLMLLDLRLPDVSGHELLEQLSEKARSLPFIVVTVVADVEQAVQMMKRGALDYIVKNSDLAGLLPTVAQRAFDHVEKERRLAAAEAVLRTSDFQMRNSGKKTSLLVANQDQELRYTWVYKFPGTKTKSKLLGKRDEDLLPLAQAQRLSGVKRQVLKSGVGVRLQMDCSFGGQAATYDINIEPILDARQRVTGLTCAAMDISSQRRCDITRRADYEVTQILSDAPDLNSAAPKTLKAICQTLNWPLGEFWCTDPDDNLARCCHIWHAPGTSYPHFELATRNLKIQKGAGLIGRVWADAKPAWIFDLAQHQKAPRMAIAVQEGLNSAFALPIIVDHDVFAVLAFFSARISEPDPELLGLFGLIGYQIGQFMVRKRAEAALRESEARFRVLAENTRDLISLRDFSGRYVFVNPAFTSLLGYSPAALLQMRVQDLVHPEDVARVSSWIDSPPVEFRIRTASGEWKWVEGSSSPLEWQGQPLSVGIALDITERKRLEHEVLDISERAQQRVGQELHDDVCQYLTGIRIFSELLANRLAQRGDKDAAAATEIATYLSEATNRARSLAHGLSPVGLDGCGLISALDEYARFVENLFHVHCDLECDSSIEIQDHVIGTHLFRITQEAVTNAVKHGGATEIELQLLRGEDGLVLSIRDNGKGMPEPLPEPAGMGLRVMNYRARTIGGSITVRNRPQRGVVVTCLVPPSGLPVGKTSWSAENIQI